MLYATLKILIYSKDWNIHVCVYSRLVLYATLEILIYSKG